MDIILILCLSSFLQSFLQALFIQRHLTFLASMSHFVRQISLVHNYPQICNVPGTELREHIYVRGEKDTPRVNAHTTIFAKLLVENTR